MSKNCYYSNPHEKKFDLGDGAFAGLTDLTILSSSATLPEHLSICSPQEQNLALLN